MKKSRTQASRKTIWIYLFICCCSLTSLWAQSVKVSGKQAQIENLEKARFEAMQRKDINFLEGVLSADLVYTHSNALVETKSDFLRSIQTGKIVYERIVVDEMKVRTYGGHTAILNGIVQVKGQLAGNSFELRLRYTDVYVKQGGKWLLASWQSTKMP